MINRIVKSAIHWLGYDLRRYRPATSAAAQFHAMLSAHNINIIFDVGANIGQFATKLRNGGYSGRIVSFEPLSTARAELLRRSKYDPQWVIAPQAAIGSQDGEANIHISGNSVSSSLLEMINTHAIAAPESIYVDSEMVSLRTLDGLASKYLQSDSILFIKIDTQGYEEQVLLGAKSMLQRAAGIQLELSMVPLYKNQLLYSELIFQMKELGFELWNLSPAFIDPITGRLLQVDATFYRH
jgi:FkbM family methyltransferase